MMSLLQFPRWEWLSRSESIWSCHPPSTRYIWYRTRYRNSYGSVGHRWRNSRTRDGQFFIWRGLLLLILDCC